MGAGRPAEAGGMPGTPGHPPGFADPRAGGRRGGGGNRQGFQAPRTPGLQASAYPAGTVPGAVGPPSRRGRRCQTFQVGRGGFKSGGGSKRYRGAQRQYPAGSGQAGGTTPGGRGGCPGFLGTLPSCLSFGLLSAVSSCHIVTEGGGLVRGARSPKYRTPQARVGALPQVGPRGCPGLPGTPRSTCWRAAYAPRAAV